MPYCIEVVNPEDPRIKAAVLKTDIVQMRVAKIAFFGVFPVIAGIPHDWKSSKENVIAVVEDDIVDGCA